MFSSHIQITVEVSYGTQWKQISKDNLQVVNIMAHPSSFKRNGVTLYHNNARPHTGQLTIYLWYIKHLTVHIRARRCMGCDIWLSTYGHVIAWAVTSDCLHMGTSLHGLWHLTVYIRACHCMGCDIWLSTYGHIIVWIVTSDCLHTGTSLHGLWHLTCLHTGTSLYGLWHLTVCIRAHHCMGCDIWLVYIRARHCMGCDIWLSAYAHVIACEVTSDCLHMGTSLHGLWHLTVHIRACHCMGCDIWLSTYEHFIAWEVTPDCPHTGMSLHGLWHLIVHIRARHCIEIMVESAIIILQLGLRLISRKDVMYELVLYFAWKPKGFYKHGICKLIDIWNENLGSNGGYVWD